MEEAVKVAPTLEQKAQEYCLQLINVNPEDLDKRLDSSNAIQEMGLGLQRETARKSEMLKRPIKDLKTQNEEKGGGVADALIDLKMQVEGLDPVSVDFTPGFISRMFGWLPFVGTPMKKYFSKFESSQTIIDAVVESLEKGKAQLRRDNVTLVEDQKEMRKMTLKLEKQIALAQLINQKLLYHLDKAVGEEKKKFIQEELLYYLGQRTVDLQQQLAVNQQGVLALEIVIRNNEELMRGVRRAINVTVTALETAVTVALALNNQKIVLDKINALNKTTDSLIANTAKRLKTQGAEIHKLASSTSLDMTTLKQAFKDVNSAMDDISKFKLEALPKMAEAIEEMNNINGEANKSIEKMEKGNTTKPTIALDI